MHRETLILLFCLFRIGDISPIGENTQIQLQAVVDGLDSRGEGFAALIDHVRGWEGSAETSESPNTSALLATPELFRGNLFTVVGQVELQKSMSAPWSGVEELFVRDGEGNLFGLYVVGKSGLSQPQTIEGPALFYKTMSIQGRDNRERLYPTFVTTQFVLQTSALQEKIPTALLAIPLLCVIAVGFFVIVKVCKGKKSLGKRRAIKTNEVLDATSETVGELPEEPSEALAMLYEDSEGAT